MATPSATLWRQPDFRKLWVGQAVSRIGSQVSFLALPLVAIVTLAGLGEPWRIGALYFSAAPRERMLEWHELPNTPFHDMPREQVAKLGTPMVEITHWLDIRPYADRKRRVLASHRSQVSVNGPMADMPPEMTERFLAMEQLRRAPLPWDSTTVTPRIIDRLASDHPIQPPATT